MVRPGTTTARGIESESALILGMPTRTQQLGLLLLLVALAILVAWRAA